MVIVTLRQIIDERISFLIEQINPANKPQVNKTFQLQIDAIRFASNDLEKVEPLIVQKKAQLKRAMTSMNQRSCLQSLMVWNGYNGKY
ncbi:MAG: hypothetical protein ACJ71D_08610 [Nitrososphaera sp.]